MQYFDKRPLKPLLTDESFSYTLRGYRRRHETSHRTQSQTPPKKLEQDGD